MSISGNVSQVQHMAQAAIQFGRAQNASKQQNMKYIEKAHAEQQQAASSVVDQAVELSSQAATTKGRIIDAMV